jgi:hypothetical protein
MSSAALTAHMLMKVFVAGALAYTHEVFRMTDSGGAGSFYFERQVVDSLDVITVFPAIHSTPQPNPLSAHVGEAVRFEFTPIE